MADGRDEVSSADGSFDPSNAAPFDIGRTTRVWVGGGNRAPRQIVELLVGAASRPTAGPIDVAIVLPKSFDELHYFAAKLRLRMTSGGRLWVVGAADAVELTSGPANTSLAPLGFVKERTMVIEERHEAACWVIP